MLMKRPICALQFYHWEGTNIQPPSPLSGHETTQFGGKGPQRVSPLMTSHDIIIPHMKSMNQPCLDIIFIRFLIFDLW